MSGKIRLLPDNVANQIAAGEVVNRPASVVKEMMENAVDAGSSCVTVNFRDGGRELIQIIDDGEGMSQADARLAFDKHATSKIKSLDDVYKLHTFGFRGEALASIAAISTVELVTRREGDELGVKVTIEGSTFKGQEMVVAPKGSKFSVKNIFFNVPARRRQLDKSTTESRYITSEFQRVALCHPDVAFKLYNDDAPVYDLPASSLKQRVIGIIGRGIANNLLEVGTKTSIVEIEGFVGAPSAARKSSDQFMFVNGRYFKSPYLHKAILQAYEKLIPMGVQPSYFIYMKVDPENLDVNIHPQKTEVRFEDGPAVWQILNASVREALARTGVIPMMDFEDEKEVEIPVLDGGRDMSSVHVPSSTFNPEYNPFRSDRMARPSKGMDGMSELDAMFGARTSYPQIDREEPAMDESVLDFIEVGDDGEQGELNIARSGEMLKVVPLAGGYVATSFDGRLVLVDVKRAKEAVLYRRYMMMLESGSSAGQTLLFPERMVFSRDDVVLLGENYDEFVGLGFDYNVVDENTIELVAIPADLNMERLSDVMYDMLDCLRDEVLDKDMLRKKQMAEVLSRRCGEDRLNESELMTVLNTLRERDEYKYTADGRAVMQIVEPDEIKRRFTK